MSNKEIRCFVYITCIAATILLLAGCASNGEALKHKKTHEISGSSIVTAPATYSEQAIIRHGTVELAFGDPKVETLDVAYVKYQGEQAIRFNVIYDQALVDDQRGFLYITPDKIAFIVNNDDGSQRTFFNYMKSEVTRFTALDHWHDFDEGLLTDNYGTMFVVSGDDETALYPLWRTQDGYSHDEDSVLPDDLVNKAWTAYAMWINMAWSNFSGAVNQFVRLSANASMPLTPAQSEQITALEREADMAAANGQYAKALSDCLAALQALPAQWAPLDVTQRLQRKAIGYALRSNPPPSVPADALRHEVYGKTAIANGVNAGDLDQGIQELTQAVRLAPWWADGYYNLAVALEKAQRYSQAADSLQDYLLTKPNASDANAVQMKIYSLQYEASHGAQ